MRASRPAVLAALLLTLEGIALGIVSVIELVKLTRREVVSTPAGTGLVVLTLLAAVALVAFAYGVLRRVSWARSGAIVFQVLAIAVAVSSVTLETPRWGFALAVGVPGMIGLVLVILAARADGGSDRRLPAEED
ncbi:hypothetical protein [Microbacterium sp.]|uniref:hypothetical protein n=1 Tax=Microbacterium sp. TaxID=51671 RepID=UPI0033414132